MNYGIIKSVGNGQVDVQLTGSAMVMRNVQISAQVNWNTLVPGTRVLVDSVDSRPIVLHTIVDVPHLYTTEEQTYAAPGVYGPENALLADGSVPLTGNLSVTPGITIDGYDISVLGQTIDNLQAADSVARTGYTVMTHASHLVETIGEDDTQLKIRHDLFLDKEGLVVSNTAGEVEFMRVVGQAVPTVDDHGALCYLYTVTRRTSTNPSGLVTGWATATLVNGLTHKGYITFDAREGWSAAPSMRFVLHTDIDTGATEHIMRAGSLYGILDYADEDYGFAVGRLTTADKFLAYSYADNRFRIRGADFSGEDETGTEAFRVWGIAEGERVPGDFRFGPASGGHQEWTSETQRLSIFNGANEVIYFSPTESRFKNMVWAGSEAGPQIGIGELNGEGHIIARNSFDVAQFVVRTRSDTEGVYIFAGNPKPQAGWMEFDNGLTVDGTIRARALEIIGQAVVGDDTSEIIIRDPADPRRYGHIKPHYLAGYSVDSTDTQYLSTLIAWAPAVLEAQPGSGVFRTWIAGESFFGDWRYGHFRIERNGRVGLFNGDTPKAWMDTAGDFHASGEITAASGTIGGWTINPTNLASADGSTVLKSVGGIVLDAQVARFDSATLKWMQGTTEYLRMGTFVDLGSVTGSVIESKVVDLTVTSDGSIYLVPGAGGTVMLGGTSYGEGGSNYTEVAKDGSVVQRGSATFTATNGVIGPTWKPISNSTTALQMQNALGTATVLNADTTNARIGIGTTAPATPLHVNMENATTAVVDSILTLSKSSTDTPAAYFGSGIEFNLKSTTTANRPASTINTLWADPANGAEIAAVTLNTVYGGSLTNVAKFGGTLGTVLNEDGNAWNDLRVEGDTDTHLIFVDASADKVGISESAPNATLDVNGTTRLGDSDTNYSAFDATGHLTFNGTAKPWNDMLIEPSARTTGTNAPTFEKWYDDAAGTSRGVYLYSFDDANAGSEKEVFFTLQMSHAWDGGDIQFHVHWIGAVDDVSTDESVVTPRWGLEYVFKEPGAVFGDSTIVYATGKHTGEMDVVANKHYITAFTAISPGSTANDLSSVLIGRLFRNSSNAADTYNATGAKCGLLYIDAHYQIARIGSTDEYSA